MEPVVKLHGITKGLQGLLSEPILQEKRDVVIKKISTLLDERDQVISEIKPPFTDEKRKLGAEIVQMNAFIDGKLDALKQEIQLDIANLKKKKASTTKYINPYNSAPADGMFFDKKK